MRCIETRFPSATFYITTKTHILAQFTSAIYIKQCIPMIVRMFTSSYNLNVYLIRIIFVLNENKMPSTILHCIIKICSMTYYLYNINFYMIALYLLFTAEIRLRYKYALDIIGEMMQNGFSSFHTLLVGLLN